MADKEDKILKYMTAEDIPEACMLLFEYLNFDLDDLKNEGYYAGDGIDMFRYLVKHLGGLEFRIPRIKSLPGANERYISERISQEPNIHIRRLAHETKLDEKTIREYLRKLKP